MFLHGIQCLFCMLFNKNSLIFGILRIYQSLLAFRVLFQSFSLFYNLGYAIKGDGQKALDFFEQMQREGMLLMQSCFSLSIYKACGSSRSLDKGKKVHGNINVVTYSCCWKACGEDCRQILYTFIGILKASGAIGEIHNANKSMMRYFVKA